MLMGDYCWCVFGDDLPESWMGRAGLRHADPSGGGRIRALRNAKRPQSCDRRRPLVPEWAQAYETVSFSRRLTERNAPPIPKKPTSSIAQVEGSGTPGVPVSKKVTCEKPGCLKYSLKAIEAEVIGTAS